jgi:PAS domain S-box-containing protein
MKMNQKEQEMIVSLTKIARRYLFPVMITLVGAVLTLIAFSFTRSILTGATPDFISVWRNSEPWGILWGGLLFTGLLAGYLTFNIRRTERVIEKRTMELWKSNERLSHQFAERSRVEDELKQQLNFLQTLIDAVPAPIFYKDAQGRYLGCNEAFASCNGQTRDEIIGKTVYDMAPKELADIYNVADNALLSTQGVQRYESSARFADGIRREVYITQTTFKDLAGRVAGLVGVMLDISERKRAEKDIRRLNKELAEKVEQLIEAQEELVRKEKLAMLGQLAGSVGHELRNPLGVMNNAVFFLKTVMTNADDIVTEYLEILEHEIDNSQRIISEILEFACAKTPNRLPIQVKELVSQSLMQSDMQGNIDLCIDIPETLPPINVDPFQMKQVFQNLITNALQAMPEGGTLSIGARSVPSSKFKVQGSDTGPWSPVPGPDALIEIAVVDTGTGITPENMKRLFQPLFSTKARGIGLGLAISKSLAEANGGAIEVSSRLGEGTTFTVTLPAVGKEEET